MPLPAQPTCAPAWPARLLAHRLGGPVTAGAICLLVFFANLGRPYLWDPDEGRHAEIAREMLVTGNWLTPTLAFEPYHDKPILFYWMLALSLRTFGPNEWAARLPSAVSACLGVAATAWWGTRFLGPLAGILGAIILATAGEYVAVGRFVLVDMAFSWWLAAAFFYGSYWCLEGREGGRPLWPFYALLALATLTKGPVAVVLAVLTFALFLYRGQLLGLVPELRLRRGILVFLGVAGSWYVAAAIAAPDYIAGFLWLHNVKRFTSATVGHPGPPLAYLYLLPGCFLPWSAYLPAVALHASRRIKTRSSLALEFCFLWTVVTIVFFSLSRAKLPTYILPVFPPLALLSADALAKAARRDSLSRLEELLHCGAFVTLAALLVVAPVGGYLFLRLKHPGHAAMALLPLLSVPAIAAGFRWLRSRRFDLLLFTVLGLALAHIVGFYRIAAPVLNQAYSLKGAAQMLRATPERTRLLSFRAKTYSLLFYSQRLAEPVEGLEEAGALLSGPEPTALLTKRHLIEALRCRLTRVAYVWWGGEMKKVLVVNRPPPPGIDVTSIPLTVLDPAYCNSQERASPPPSPFNRPS